MMNEILNKVIHGDCFEELKKFPDNSVDLIITDPPYGMDFQSNYRKEKHLKIQGDDAFPIELMDEFFRIARKGVYVFCRWDNLKELPKPKSCLAWVKNNWSMGDLEHEHGRQWEAICFYPQEGHKFIKRIPDVIKCDRTGNNLHPTEKPIKLLRTLIKANEGQVILDPFAGSGSTLVACKQLERDFIGIEIEKKYVDIINHRLSQNTLNWSFGNNQGVRFR